MGNGKAHDIGVKDNHQPGPGQYETSKDIIKDRNPISLGGKAKESVIEKLPGPGQYYSKIDPIRP